MKTLHDAQNADCTSRHIENAAGIFDGGSWSGGDGAYGEDANGLTRGE